MSKVGITLAYRGDENVPALRTDLISTNAAITSSAVSQQTTISAEDSQYWMITTDGTIWINFGTNPTAIAGSGFMLWAGTYYFQAKIGDKCAVIDA